MFMQAGIPEPVAHPLMVLCQVGYVPAYPLVLTFLPQFYRQHCTGHRFATGNVEILTGRKVSVVSCPCSRLASASQLARLPGREQGRFLIPIGHVLRLHCFLLSFSRQLLCSKLPR
jgi:hypothetical protein